MRRASQSAQLAMLSVGIILAQLSSPLATIDAGGPSAKLEKAG